MLYMKNRTDFFSLIFLGFDEETLFKNRHENASHKCTHSLLSIVILAFAFPNVWKIIGPT